jgi:thiosulfate reductase cytochrome b subunit
MTDVASPLHAAAAEATAASARPGQLYYRHRLPVRVMHWINVMTLTILFMSGLNIFEAHPALYWGASSYTGRPALLEIGARDGVAGQPVGYTRVLGHEFDTTGVLGVHRTADGMTTDAFPGWLTIPSGRWLSMARSWHFFFAWVFLLNGLCFVVYSVVSRHLARDLWPTRGDIRGIGASIVEHLKFRHPGGEAAKRYNVLQKLAYLVVIFVLLPLVVLMGAAMSPRLDAVLTGWVDLFGGRQSARTIHFVVAWLLVGFAAIHVLEVVITGLWNNLRSMITGRYRVPQETGHD